MLDFARCYTLWVGLALLATHGELAKHQSVVGPRTRFGHWYYPLPAGAHATLFGVWPLRRLPQSVWRGVGALLLALLLLAGATGAVGAGVSSTPPPLLRGLVFGTAALLCLLYLGQARTHGLVHNKADLVPWVLAILAWSPPDHVTATVRLLLGLVYGSSGLHKLRTTGLRWTHGRNLQMLVLKFMLELRQAAPNPLQRLLLASEPVAGLAQCSALAFELGFFPLVVLGAPALGIWEGRLLLLAFGAFFAAFHASILWSMSVDFVRFWVPTLLALVLPTGDADAGDGGGGGGLPTLSALLASSWLPWALGAAFVAAHVGRGDGRQWPCSSFDLYNVFFETDRLEYVGVDLLCADGCTWRPFDLSVVSSSGATRSFGFHLEKSRRLPTGDRDMLHFLGRFLPKYLEGNGHAPGTFLASRTVRLAADRFGGQRIADPEPTGVCVYF